MGFRIVKILQKLKIQKQKRQKNFSRLYLNFHNRWDINSEILRYLIRICQYFAGNAFSELPSYFQITKEEIKELDNKMKQLEEQIAILEKKKSEKEEKIRSSLKKSKALQDNKR